MMKLRPFELVLVTIFGLLALVALAMISTYKPPVDETTQALGDSVVIWGTVPNETFQQVLIPLKEQIEAYRAVSYVEKDARSFDSELLNALAENRGPDIIFIPHEKLLENRSKIQPVSYESFPLRDFQNLYIDGAEIFALRDGVYAYPVAIDPLVMYYNRDLLATKNIINPPATWEGVVNDIIPALVERDYNRSILRSPLAFGEYRNVNNSFAIMSMLLLQGGSAMVSEGDGKYLINLNMSINRAGLPFENALTFYTNFASPSNPLYSWNRALGLDRDEFVSERLVLYFGKGSEARQLAAQNPNLNFDIAEVPQGAQSTVRRTYASFYGLALLKSSPNKAGAFTVLQTLGAADKSQVIADALNMAPAHRTNLNAGSNDQYGRIAYQSSIVARGWLSPSPARTNEIFGQMVDDVLSNRARPSQSANDAVSRLSELY
ncbi:ABC transporter substrate-binding protein [Patescibacteria group bacterium]|nr:ABC transporter substrate-binding protein [Patescibacteria group bacterium]